ncbi:hypothetical protein RRF57_011442 [Xylaria bambusicola]|uniref:Uncharacterized protein n=1 Tax=Xylaria bambusicola TaxID=326684 RepID=A0AAN7UMU7_9PEZI
MALLTSCKQVLIRGGRWGVRLLRPAEDESTVTKNPFTEAIGRSRCLLFSAYQFTSPDASNFRPDLRLRHNSGQGGIVLQKKADKKQNPTFHDADP